MNRRLGVALLVYGALALSIPARAQTSQCPCMSPPAANKPAAETSQVSPRPCLCKKPSKPLPNRAAPAVSVNVNLSAADEKKCDVEQEKAKLKGATYEREGGHLDKASEKYDKLLASCDLDTKKDAQFWSERTHAKINSWWWQFGEKHPIFRWVPLYPIRCLLVLLCLAALIWLFPMLLSVLPDAYAFLFQPPFEGAAIIIRPTALNKDAPVVLFAASLQSNSRLARELLSGDRRHFQVRSTNLLSVPSEVASTAFKGLPKISGVDPVGTFTALSNLTRYLTTWRVETDLAYFPSPEDASEMARMEATSTLRWAWLSEPPITVAREVKNAQDVDALAFAVAARILGRYFVSA